MPRGTAVGSCRRGAGRHGPAAVPRDPTAGSAILPLAPRRQDPTAIGFGARCIFLEIFSSTIYFSKIKQKI
jgi:hypothetical protein